MRFPRGRFISAALALVLAYGCASLFLPHRPPKSEIYVDIPPGAGSLGMARLLADAGAIPFGWQFLAIRLLRPRTTLQAGEYAFTRPASPWEVFNRLARGDVFFYSLTVPEGQNMFEIAAALDRMGVIGARGFLEAARDPSLIRDLAPEAPSLEGFLFPDTYRIRRNTTARDLCLMMTQRFRQAWSELKTDRPVLPTVTLASLIEKETALDEERPLVASVFVNRLKAGLPLACDPTVIYAALLEDRYRGEIYQSDLASRNRYNTYRHTGLPPGPIANAGMDSLRAALKPAETRYLYFVARPDGSGAHVFSENIESHQRAVARYRRGSQKTKQTAAPGRVSSPSSAGANH